MECGMKPFHIQIMVKGKWTDHTGLNMVRRGNVFRVPEGPNQWGLPRIALGHAMQELHPKNQKKVVFSVLYKCGATMGRIFEPLHYGRDA
jgi:hypothetical protein